MKQVIDGKRYDTETATLIAEASSSERYSDFRYWHEELYRTRKGAWFVAGKGGAMSRWSTPIESNGRGPGSGIEVLSEGEALQWCERHQIDADIISAHFQVEDA